MKFVKILVLLNILIFCCSVGGNAAVHVIENDFLKVVLDDKNHGMFSVIDKRLDKSWTQEIFGMLRKKVIFEVQRNDASIKYKVRDTEDDYKFEVNISFQYEDEISIVLSEIDGLMGVDMRYPFPFVSAENLYVVLPHNEGMIYSVKDISSKIPGQLHLYSGWDSSMPMFGYTDLIKGVGYMCIIDTPNDAKIRTVIGQNGLLESYIHWEDEKVGVMGYNRVLYYKFYDKDGDYVRMAKDIRAYAESKGWVKTLKEKKKENGNVNKLFGALSLWIDHGNINKKQVIKIVNDLKKEGIKKAIVYCNNYDAKLSEIVSVEGFLPGKYYNFQDVWDAKKHHNRNDTGWPNGLVLNKDLSPIAGYKDGGRVCTRYIYSDNKSMLFDILGSDVNRKLEVAFHDTVTATGFTECFNPLHPTTRSDCRSYREKILKYSNENNLIVGSEQGSCFFLNYVHYYEGMQTMTYEGLGSFPSLVAKSNPEFKKYQLGFKYKIPLFELAFHDCVVSYSRWDASNLMGQRDEDNFYAWKIKELWNILYGHPPLVHMYYMKDWNKYKKRIASSWKESFEATSRLGDKKMKKHEFLSDDWSKQRTLWEDGTEITVDFIEETCDIKWGNNED